MGLYTEQIQTRKRLYEEIIHVWEISTLSFEKAMKRYLDPQVNNEFLQRSSLLFYVTDLSEPFRQWELCEISQSVLHYPNKVRLHQASSSTMVQLCDDDASNTVLIENNGVTWKWVTTPNRSDSFVFNENRIASVIAE